jgi:hypothetical protein
MAKGRGRLATRRGPRALAAAPHADEESSSVKCDAKGAAGRAAESRPRLETLPGASGPPGAARR